MKIAVRDIYGVAYKKDGFFRPEVCKISANLLMPNILLKQEIEMRGDEIHTADVYGKENADVYIFQDIHRSIHTVTSFLDFLKYLLRGDWKEDTLHKALKSVSKDKVILVKREPQAVAPRSYNDEFYKLFGKVLTWDDSLVDKYGFTKYSIPQFVPEKFLNEPLEMRKLIVLVCSNKGSQHPEELYSERRRVINYFEEKEDGLFDLFGFGWEEEHLKNYNGSTNNKQETLSHYKFCICLENQRNVRGNITEKIFDCFYAGCVPIYYGAPNILEYIPAETFVDYSQFSSLDDMLEFVKSLDDSSISKYISAARAYLESDRFKETFYYKRYVELLLDAIYS